MWLIEGDSLFSFEIIQMHLCLLLVYSMGSIHQMIFVRFLYLLVNSINIPFWGRGMWYCKIHYQLSLHFLLFMKQAKDFRASMRLKFKTLDNYLLSAPYCARDCGSHPFIESAGSTQMAKPGSSPNTAHGRSSETVVQLAPKHCPPLCSFLLFWGEVCWLVALGVFR